MSRRTISTLSFSTASWIGLKKSTCWHLVISTIYASNILKKTSQTSFCCCKIGCITLKCSVPDAILRRAVDICTTWQQQARDFPVSADAALVQGRVACVILGVDINIPWLEAVNDNILQQQCINNDCKLKIHCIYGTV